MTRKRPARLRLYQQKRRVHRIDAWIHFIVPFTVTLFVVGAIVAAMIVKANRAG